MLFGVLSLLTKDRMKTRLASQLVMRWGGSEHGAGAPGTFEHEDDPLLCSLGSGGGAKGR